MAYPLASRCERSLSRGLILLLFCFLLTSCGKPAEVPTGRPAPLVDGIIATDLVDANVTNALNVLRLQISRTFEKLSPDLTNAFEISVVRRLKEIQASVTNHYDQSYKRAVIAKRVLELAGNVLALPYRAIPKSAAIREKAQHQLAETLKRVEREAPAKLKNLDTVASNLIKSSIQGPLGYARTDIFRPGFGQALSEEEWADLNRVLDNTLAAAAELPKKVGNSPPGKTSLLREAATVGHDARMAIDRFFRERETSAFKAFSLGLILRKWHQEIASLEQTIDRNMEVTERAEIAAVQTAFNQQAARDRVENDPEYIDRKRREASEADQPAKDRP